MTLRTLVTCQCIVGYMDNQRDRMRQETYSLAEHAPDLVPAIMQNRTTPEPQTSMMGQMHGRESHSL